MRGFLHDGEICLMISRFDDVRCETTISESKLRWEVKRKTKTEMVCNILGGYSLASTSNMQSYPFPHFILGEFYQCLIGQ